MEMRRLIVMTFISLDGVMQAPGGPDEDTSGGFEHGGWTFPFFDETAQKIMDDQISGPFDLLLGRKTYDIFAAYWPKQQQDFGFNKATKYVVSHNSIRLPWERSVLLRNAGQIKELKAAEGPVLHVHGSGNLVQTLLKEDLVDELWLKIFPVTLGNGKRLFADGTIPAAFKLVRSEVTPSGVMAGWYKREGEVKTGSFSS